MVMYSLSAGRVTEETMKRATKFAERVEVKGQSDLCCLVNPILQVYGKPICYDCWGKVCGYA